MGGGRGRCRGDHGGGCARPGGRRKGNRKKVKGLGRTQKDSEGLRRSQEEVRRSREEVRRSPEEVRRSREEVRRSPEETQKKSPWRPIQSRRWTWAHRTRGRGGARGRHEPRGRGRGRAAAARLRTGESWRGLARFGEVLGGVGEIRGDRGRWRGQRESSGDRAFAQAGIVDGAAQRVRQRLDAAAQPEAPVNEGRGKVWETPASAVNERQGRRRLSCG